MVWSEGEPKEQELRDESDQTEDREFQGAEEGFPSYSTLPTE